MKIQPGHRVRLTGAFLRNTGQTVGGEGLSRWTVVSCPCSLCKSGRFVAVDEPMQGDPDQTPRHFYTDNLERCR